MCNLIGILNLTSAEFDEIQHADPYLGIGTASRKATKIYREFVDEFQEKSGLKVAKAICGYCNEAKIDLTDLENGDLLLSDAFEDGGSIYMILEETLPSNDELDAIFLDMGKYGFNGYWRSDEVGGNTLKQQYDYGNYETGYLASGENEEYLNYYDEGFTTAESSICS